MQGHCAGKQCGSGEAEADLRDTAALAAAFGNVRMQRLALHNLATAFSAQSRPDDTLAVAREGWDLVGSACGREITALFRSSFIEAHYVRGEWGPVWEQTAAAVGEVLAVGEPNLMVSVAVAALEPLAMLGQWPRA